MRPRLASLLLLLAVLSAPGLPGELGGPSGSGSGSSCAAACGKKCCCRPSRSEGGCAMRASCCGSVPTITTTAPFPKGGVSSGVALIAPDPVVTSPAGDPAARAQYESPAPDVPPPRNAC